jgi:ribosomal protein S27AE
VDYVSLPWAPEWKLLTDKFLFFPAWICTYICMSAPFGRIVDRHIKLFRYRNHPLISAGEKIKEPLLHLVAVKPGEKSSQAKKRQQRSQRKSGPRKQNSANASSKKNNNSTDTKGKNIECPDCGSDSFISHGQRAKKCTICLTEWV